MPMAVPHSAAVQASASHLIGRITGAGSYRGGKWPGDRAIATRAAAKAPSTGSARIRLVEAAEPVEDGRDVAGEDL